jgi:hypothetical protein
MSNDEGNIITFGRMRPSKRLATNSFAINHLDKQIEFVIPKVRPLLCLELAFQISFTTFFGFVCDTGF